MKLHTVKNKCVVYSTLCSPFFTPGDSSVYYNFCSTPSICIPTFAHSSRTSNRGPRVHFYAMKFKCVVYSVLVLLLSPAYSGFREEGSRAFRSVQYNFVSTRPIVIPTFAHLTSTSNRDSRSKYLVFAIAMSGKASPKKRFAASLIQCHAMDPWKQKVAFDERRP